MEMKEFAKIGKEVLRQISNRVETYEITEKKRNESTLSEIEQAMQAISNPSNTEYIEHQQVIRTQHYRLSKSQILQYIALHFLHIDERGVIREVSENRLAEALGCTVKTIKNNNVALEECGLIYYSNGATGFNVMINNYSRYFEAGGSGYLELDFERFNNYKRIQNVNALRLELRKELVYDNHEIVRQMKKDNTPCGISFEDFKIIAPKYTHYRAMLEEIVQQGSPNFETTLKGSHIYFKLKSGIQTAKELKESRTKEYNKILLECLANNECIKHFDKKDLDSFVQLAFEYSMERVIPALESLVVKEFVLGELEPTKNFGGRLRTIIRQNIAQPTSLSA